MERKVRKVIPSVLTKDPEEFEKKIRILENYADIIQVDIMDNGLVPNISIEIDEIHKVKPKSQLEMHLMVKRPIDYIEPSVSVGAFRIIFHIESDDDPFEVIEKITQLKAKPGIAINPPTPVENIQPYLHKVDIVLVMGVNPGFQGQKFIPDVLSKVHFIKNIRPDLPVEVDGGVNPEVGPMLLSAGVDILNVGSFLFKNGNVEDNWNEMQRIINNNKN